MGTQVLCLCHHGLIGARSSIFYHSCAGSGVGIPHFPPVEIEEFGTLATFESKIDVVYATDFCHIFCGECAPLFPSSGSGNIDLCHQLATQTVEA